MISIDLGGAELLYDIARKHISPQQIFDILKNVARVSEGNSDLRNSIHIILQRIKKDYGISKTE